MVGSFFFAAGAEPGVGRAIAVIGPAAVAMGMLQLGDDFRFCGTASYAGIGFGTGGGTGGFFCYLPGVKGMRFSFFFAAGAGS